MAGLETRVQRLEQIAPAGVLHPPGRRTVNFKPIVWRDGFYLEKLNAAMPASASRTPRKFQPLRQSATEEKFKERLRGLTREEQAALAKKHGYRVVYSNNARVSH
jgi:hypothetical protein